MIRGIRFTGPNKWYSTLKLITKDIDIKKYFWFIVDKDVMGDNDNYFDCDLYNGEVFERIIQNENCYAISINLQVFPNENDVERIHNNSDFQRSKCEIIILIDDNIYIYIYAKDKENIEIIKKNAETNGFKDIRYITDDDICWKEMKT